MIMVRETASTLGSDAVVAETASTAASDGSGSLTGTTTQLASAGGLVINIIYDSSVSSAPAGFTAAISDVVQYYESVFTDPVTVTIDIGWGEVGGQSLTSGALGETETFVSAFSYGQVRGALAADAKSADDTDALASLPAGNPT